MPKKKTFKKNLEKAYRNRFIHDKQNDIAFVQTWEECEYRAANRIRGLLGSK